MAFLTVLGVGRRLFPAGRQPAYLDTLFAEGADAAVLTRYGRP